MQPLKEQGEPRYPLEADALLLLRSVERYEPPAGQKQRVTARLLARGSVGRGRVRRGPMVLVFVLCAAGASAAAAASGPWLARGYRALVGASSEEGGSGASVAAQSRAKARATSRVQPQPEPVAAPVPAPVEAAQPAAAPVAAAVPSVARANGAPSEAARAHGAAASSEPASLVFGAMQALRREGRPDRAAKLLDEYRRRYPGGALAEEALALSVEAAIERGDPRAKVLAESYLARYPSGQFRKAAERARALSSP
jgi:hypothetical protein